MSEATEPKLEHGKKPMFLEAWVYALPEAGGEKRTIRFNLSRRFVADLLFLLMSDNRSWEAVKYWAREVEKSILTGKPSRAVEGQLFRRFCTHELAPLSTLSDPPESPMGLFLRNAFPEDPEEVRNHGSENSPIEGGQSDICAPGPLSAPCSKNPPSPRSERRPLSRLPKWLRSKATRFSQFRPCTEICPARGGQPISKTTHQTHE